jgi:hypothetical protein
MKTVLAVLSAIVGAVVVMTLLTGGKFAIGTSAAGPLFSLGFSGPQAK